MNQEREKKQWKLIALDIDGTLLNDNHEVSEENIKAIKEAREKGVIIVLSTGRSIRTCEDIAKQLELSSYLVTVNGSEIWHTEGTLLERNPLHYKHIKTMWDLTNTYKTKMWAVTKDKVWRDEFPETPDAEQWLKYGFDIEDDKAREEIFSILSANEELELSNSSPTNIEVNAVGINKAVALAKVCEKEGMTMEDVIAMGDSLNDLAMIQAAGLGIAMGNAQVKVKEAADWVTDKNNEDGVAKAIRQWVL